MRWIGAMAAVILAGAAPARGAEIGGRVDVRKPAGRLVKAGYAGVDSAGTKLFNMAGLSVDSTTAEVWSTTFGTRNTGVTLDSKTGCSYRHVGLPAGTYVIYARLEEKRGDDNVVLLSDWALVRLPSAGTRHTVNLSLASARCGEIQVTAPGRKGLLGVRLTPADARGRQLFPGSDKARGLSFEADLGPRGAEIAGLRAGVYRLTLRAIDRRGTPQTGQTTMYRDLGAWTVRVQAGKRLQYRLPAPGRKAK